MLICHCRRRLTVARFIFCQMFVLLGFCGNFGISTTLSENHYIVLRFIVSLHCIAVCRGRSTTEVNPFSLPVHDLKILFVFLRSLHIFKFPVIGNVDQLSNSGSASGCTILVNASCMH